MAAGQGELAHLPVDVRPIAALPDEDRIAHIRTERWIRHTAAERVLGDLQEASIKRRVVAWRRFCFWARAAWQKHVARQVRACKRGSF